MDEPKKLTQEEIDQLEAEQDAQAGAAQAQQEEEDKGAYEAEQAHEADMDAQQGGPEGE
jgi:hypothetical protein